VTSFEKWTFHLKAVVYIFLGTTKLTTLKAVIYIFIGTINH